MARQPSSCISCMYLSDFVEVTNYRRGASIVSRSCPAEQGEPAPGCSGLGF